MENQLTPLLNQILESSAFLKALAAVSKKKMKSRLFGNKVRLLTTREIKQLKAQGNEADEWKKILVKDKFSPDHIVGNRFRGQCVLGIFTGKELKAGSSVNLSSGIYRSIIIESEIGDNCCIWNAGCIANYIVKAQSVLFNVGSLVCSRDSAFGNGRDVSVGIETGGRNVLSFAEMTIPIAQMVSTNRNNNELLEAYNNFIKKYTAACNIGFGIVENDVIIRNTLQVEDCYIGESTIIDDAILLQNSTILGSTEEPVEISHGVYVRNSCLQWGCHVTSLAIVDDSILTEHSHVERHGKLTQSILGPNTAVGEGEVTACLLGPFVGFHHQALLIAAIWPEGKGNVGYGANIGSNHTSKAPDQEIWCGEGTFFGLGVNIKFPCDFTHAPYSIIATAVNTLPQRVEFPFSLINSPGQSLPGISPAYNEIMPGWVLSDNIYMVKRNEGKYKKRNKARRTVFIFDVFRQDIIDLMIQARKRLHEVSKTKEYYTSRDIPGLGKNYMLEGSRIKGIAAYDFYIEYYCLSGLKQYIEDLLKTGPKKIDATIYDIATSHKVWEHQRNILKDNDFNKRSIKENLLRLSTMEEQIAQATQKAKEKDDERGAEIIKDYATAHSPSAQDSFVKETWSRVEKIKQEIEAIIGSNLKS